jgi:hypothetical protein
LLNLPVFRSTAIRGLAPALAVTAVIGLAFLAPVPATGSIVDVGYGYGYGGFGNNCGVKGTGFHAHGKPCPNRPFPGKGVDKSAVGDTTDSTVGDKTDSEAGDNTTAAATTTNASTNNTTSTVTEDVQSAGKSHGKGKGKGNGHGHGNGHGKGN